MFLRIRVIVILFFIFNLQPEASATELLKSLFKPDTTKTELRNYSFLSTRYHAGWVLETNDFLRGENQKGSPINSFQSLAFSYGVQTSGQKEWHHILNFPYYGVSFYNANFFNSKELGYPAALYGFLGMPLKRWPRSAFGYELGFGMAYNWRPYDSDTNPFNLAIGSRKTVYIDASLVYSYNLTPRWQLKTGFGFTHFSNGAMKKPNAGINLVSPFVELNYSLRDKPMFVRQPQPAYPKHYEVALQLGAGVKEEMYKNPTNGDLRAVGSFTVVNFSAAWLKQVTWKNKWGAGFDLTYDNQGNLKVNNNTPDGIPELMRSTYWPDHMKLGIYGTYEFCIDRLSIASHLGFYALRKHFDTEQPLIYQKVGLKYHFKNDVYLGLLVRAYRLTVADVIEWNVGYRIKWD
ncbi:MAG: acyloxyacyl hydrolase [Mangrovibacterium sp.]